MIENKWSLTVEKQGQVVSHKEGALDPFTQLITTPVPASAAKVSYGYGASKPYGEEKVNCTVTISCDQTEAAINEAGYLAFRKVVELVNEGIQALETRDKETKR